MNYSSHIEINKTALGENLDFIRGMIPDTCIFSSVIKGNAYGHGIEVYVPLAEEFAVNHFSVFSASEALRVKNVSNGFSKVLIMGLMSNTEMEWAIDNEIEFFVFDRYRLDEAIVLAKKIKKKAIIHLEIETGLNRTGFNLDEMDGVVATLLDNDEYIMLQGVCSHFAGAESITNYLRIKRQLLQFNKTIKAYANKGVSFPSKHFACSAAMVNYPKSTFDMVRVGIMQYGFWSSKETLMNYLAKQTEKIDPLKRIISWKSRVMSIKEIGAGEFVGYGTTFLSEMKMKVAIIPVGYSDGYSRSLSNQGRVIIRGQRVSVVGLVNMNMLMVDITTLEGVEVGDETIIIGGDKDVDVSVSSFSELSSQLNYELLTRLPNDIPRLVVE